MNKAILLLIWRRPIQTRRLIDSLRKISPKKIYISSDGPIFGNFENENLVTKTRELVLSEIDWECEILTNFSKINKGCKKAVTDGINWFFTLEDEGIILEDDCIPNKYFFKFCSDLLEKYRHDERIWAICGNGYQKEKYVNHDSYFFSRYVDIWGWATWKRCWKLYDPEIKSWGNNNSSSILKDIFEDKRELKYWTKIFDDIFYKNKPDTWDYQWQYLCFINSGMACMPFTNTVENIGFGEGATHTNESSSQIFKNNKKSGIDFPLKHPITFIRSKDCDKHIQEIFYSGYPKYSISYFISKLKNLF